MTSTTPTAAQPVALVPLALAGEPWGLTPRYLRRLVEQHGLVHYRIGGRILVDPADLAAMIAAGRRGARTG